VRSVRDGPRAEVVVSVVGPDVARMARFGVRSGSRGFARSDKDPANKRVERTGANGRERSLALAMQKVVGSSPIIRSEIPLQMDECRRRAGKRWLQRGCTRR
jgi:hypothetical protein